MKKLYQKLDNSERWKKAQESLNNFEVMMKSVKKYPLKPIKFPPKSPPYEVS